VCLLVRHGRAALVYKCVTLEVSPHLAAYGRLTKLLTKRLTALWRLQPAGPKIEPASGQWIHQAVGELTNQAMNSSIRR
jgi:hypothetical protein